MAWRDLPGRNELRVGRSAGFTRELKVENVRLLANNSAVTAPGKETVNGYPVTRYPVDTTHVSAGDAAVFEMTLNEKMLDYWRCLGGQTRLRREIRFRRSLGVRQWHFGEINISMWRGRRSNRGTSSRREAAHCRNDAFAWVEGDLRSDGPAERKA